MENFQSCNISGLYSQKNNGTHGTGQQGAQTSPNRGFPWGNYGVSVHQLPSDRNQNGQSDIEGWEALLNPISIGEYAVSESDFQNSCSIKQEVCTDSVSDETLKSEQDQVEWKAKSGSDEAKVKKKKVRRKQTPQQRLDANVRERNRMDILNNAFSSLRRMLPDPSVSMARINILNEAIGYINNLSELLKESN